MDSYTLFSFIVALAIFIGYLNERIFKQQATIAIMSGSLIVATALIILQHLGISNLYVHAENLVLQAHFEHLLLNGMLSFLLFAGALTIDFNSLKSQKWEIVTLASVSTISSACLIATALFYLTSALQLPMPFIYCLLFGSLISPTDPIAVLATFKRLGISKKLSTCVAGESLFNDGVGIVLFITLLELSTSSNASITAHQVFLLFCQEALGGIIFGIALGWLTTTLAKPLKEANAIILFTIGIVSGGYCLAQQLHVSGPLAMVTTGIYVSCTLHHKIPEIHFHDLKKFWEIIDELLNAILFLLIGFELLSLHASTAEIITAVLIIPITLTIRWITTGIPMRIISYLKDQSPYTISILTWGGLRGGLAVALAMSLPVSEYRNFIMTLTYAVVAFALIVQGSTIAPLARKTMVNPG